MGCKHFTLVDWYNLDLSSHENCLYPVRDCIKWQNSMARQKVLHPPCQYRQSVTRTKVAIDYMTPLLAPIVGHCQRLIPTQSLWMAMTNSCRGNQRNCHKISLTALEKTRFSINPYGLLALKTFKTCRTKIGETWVLFCAKNHSIEEVF